MNIDYVSDIDPSVFADALLSLKSSRYHDSSFSLEVCTMDYNVATVVVSLSDMNCKHISNITSS